MSQFRDRRIAPLESPPCGVTSPFAAMVRVIRPGDVPGIERVRRLANPGSRLTAERLQQLLIEPLHYCLVALSSDEPGRRTAEIEGFLLWQRYAERYRLLSVAVLPERQRRGVGRLLVRGLLARADHIGVRQIDAVVEDRNFAACHFLKACGFGLSVYRLDRFFFNHVRPNPSALDPPRQQMEIPL